MSVSSIKQIAKDLMILQNSGILKSPSLRSSFTASYFSLNPNASAILSESMYSSMNQHLKAVTPDQIHQLARDLFSAPATLALVGPFRSTAKFEKVIA